MASGPETPQGRAPSEAEKLRTEEELMERNRSHVDAAGRMRVRRSALTAVTMLLIALALWLMMR